MTIEELQEAVKKEEVQKAIEDMVKNYALNKVELERSLLNASQTLDGQDIELHKNQGSQSNKLQTLDDQTPQKLNTNDKTPEQLKAEEVAKRQNQMGAYEREADQKGNNDGETDGNEQKDADKAKEADKDRAAAIAGALFGAGVTASTGSVSAGMFTYNNITGDDKDKGPTV